jgi:hypothetical protein
VLDIRPVFVARVHLGKAIRIGLAIDHFRQSRGLIMHVMLLLNNSARVIVDQEDGEVSSVRRHDVWQKDETRPGVKKVTSSSTISTGHQKLIDPCRLYLPMTSGRRDVHHECQQKCGY